MSSPRVSAVMPVGMGIKYYQMALGCFLSQDYEGELEIIIVDNSDEPIESHLPDDPKIKYVRSDRLPVGALRNVGNVVATGEVLINWDEDDWSHQSRVTEQVNRLNESGKAVTGWHNLYFYNTHDGSCFKYLYGGGRCDHEPYACGTSQTYLKTWWESHPYPSSGIEDYWFQSEANKEGQLDSVDASSLCVARAHSDSQCPIANYIGRPQFPRVSRDALPKEFWVDIAQQVLPKAE